MSNYPLTTPSQVGLQVLLNFASDRATFVHGPAGTGKSDVLTSLSKNKSIIRLAWAKWAAATGQEPKNTPLEVCHFTIPQHEPEDFTGVPSHIMIEGRKATQWAPIEIFHRQEPFILFLDELSSAEPRTQKVLLQLIQERMIAGVKLCPGVVILLAGNMAEDRAHVKSVPFPLGNRCGHYRFQPTAEAWMHWAQTGKSFVADDAMPNAAAFDKYIERVIAGEDTKAVADVFLSWVKMKQEAGIHAYDAANPSLAQLTPRSFYHAAMAWQLGVDLQCKQASLDDVIQANIGIGSGSELCAFLNLRTKLPTWEEIVNNPNTAKLPQEGKFDQLYFITSVLISNLKKPELKDKAADSSAIYCGRLIESSHSSSDAMAWLVDEIVKLAHKGGKLLDHKSKQIQQILAAFEKVPVVANKILEFYNLVSE